MRRAARECAVKLIYEYQFSKQKDAETAESLSEEFNLTDADREYLATVYDGVMENFTELMAKLDSKIKGFSEDRIFKIDRAVMLVALYELEFMPEVPKKVAISEAIEIAKAYSTERSGGYVNGVLANFLD